MPHIAGIGAIKGIDAEDSVAAQKRIFLFDRTNMKLVSQTVSDATGGYAFNGLNAETNDYLIFSVDDDGSPRKQPIIYDYVQPIPAQQGETFWGNYYKLVMADAPAAGFFGSTDSQGKIDTIGDKGLLFTGTGLTANLTSITPGAPLLPVTSVDNGAIGMNARGTGYRFDANPCKVSVEWTLTRSSVTQNTCLLANLKYSSSDINVASWPDNNVIALLYNPSSKVLTIYNNTGASNPSGVFSNMRSLISYDLTSKADNVTVIATVDYGYQANLYVNGALVSTASLSGQNTATYFIDGSTRFAGLTIGGLGSGTVSAMNIPSTFKTGPAFIYPTILTLQQVTDRYNALMVGSSPLETGYAKEVMLDHPKFYFRLRDANGSTSFKNWLHPNTGTHDLTIFNPATLNFNQSSPVAGSSAVKFNGTSAARGSWVNSSTTSTRELSFGFIVTPTATPTATEIIVSINNDADVVFSRVSRLTSGLLRFEVRANSATETYDFTTAITNGITYHVIVTINKVTQVAKLYLNNVLVETLSTNAIVLDVANLFLDNQARYCLIGGIANTALSSATNQLNATLTEVAFYTYELSASRVTAQYDAMPVL